MPLSPRPAKCCSCVFLPRLPSGLTRGSNAEAL